MHVPGFIVALMAIGLPAGAILAYFYPDMRPIIFSIALLFLGLAASIILWGFGYVWGLSLMTACAVLYGIWLKGDLRRP